MKTPRFEHFRNALEKILPKDGRPVVVDLASWTLAKEFAGSEQDLDQAILDELLEAVGTKRTLLLPAYTNGYREEFLDLDSEPCTTGKVNELFRKIPGTLRTASAWFSFAVRGPGAEALAKLRPKEIWGRNSVFEWMEKNDALVLRMGTRWKMCSLFHRAEWLAKVPYRYPKIAAGKVQLNGKLESLKETLFVRHLVPLVLPEWTGVTSLFKENGMESVSFGTGELTGFAANKIMSLLVPLLQEDPYRFVRSPEPMPAPLAKTAT